MERKRAIVTGGARGIGRGSALALARAGFDLAIVDIAADTLAATREELADEGADVLAYEADVADHSRAKAVVADVVARAGRIDVLVNNAGRSAPQGILEITEAEFDAAIAVNLKSCFNYIQAVAPVMLEAGGGRIVSMSSLNAHSGGVTSAVSRFAYAAAKAGILGMTRALAKELAPTITVNAICPGVIATEATGHMIAAREAELTKGIALGRLGTPADIASLVVFLASAEPCFITGQDFVVDGFQWVM
ncbi:short-chain dehydrogenase [Acuticoccus sediminis]|uniref:Short-chain dehydrogenase n=1 Tax=Acuticoccus sediminis TaxID=2184697 RepID=A0A8B2NSP6_9HYPH|nr:SDR family NAD(P)-dependent oxidoreductase [Acuticoccus sediminis]RAI00174.1 short-chain dehydrogenase [Acuticoccus sediminis]